MIVVLNPTADCQIPEPPAFRQEAGLLDVSRKVFIENSDSWQNHLLTACQTTVLLCFDFPFSLFSYFIFVLFDGDYNPTYHTLLLALRLLTVGRKHGVPCLNNVHNRAVDQ